MEAADEVFLLEKVILLFGIYGAMPGANKDWKGWRKVNHINITKLLTFIHE
jgi:hypothetical protein